MSKPRDVFIALADPTRRQILELLRDEGPLNAGEIAGVFTDVSRPGISRHLRVLRECRVVSAAAHGRENRYSLETGPIADARDGWMATFTGGHLERLKALRREVEGRR